MTPTPPRRLRHAAGFTLIEIMVTVAIIGILASVALPTLQRSVLRARASERAALLVRLKQAVQDYYLRNGTLIPPGYGPDLTSSYNPPWPPTTARRAMATNLADWNAYFSAAGGGSSLRSEFEGGVFYCYRFVIHEDTDAASLTVLASGDLDGDGLVSTKSITFTRREGALFYDSETPESGAEDADTF